jgi:putative FmdB family regulatory protein
MPKYTYYCEQCNKHFSITHGMTETANPCECGEILKKLPSVPLSLKSKTTKNKTGDVVKSSIEEFKKDLKEDRRAASNKEM